VRIRPEGLSFDVKCDLATDKFRVSLLFCRAMLCKRGLRCHAVSVCVSVTFVYSVKTNKFKFQFFFHRRVATPFEFFRTKRNGNIPTGTPLTGASNADGVCRNRDYEPISGLIACCERYDRQMLSTRLSADIWLSIDDWWTLCYQLTVVRPMVYHSNGASLFTAQKATHQ